MFKTSGMIMKASSMIAAIEKRRLSADGAKADQKARTPSRHSRLRGKAIS
ncbi:hypothetical protein PO124_33725 [Bacillus licheniformis]|nr:hypothetical protein [Bacillus licheniformis]